MKQIHSGTRRNLYAHIHSQIYIHFPTRNCQHFSAAVACLTVPPSSVLAEYGSTDHRHVAIAVVMKMLQHSSTKAARVKYRYSHLHTNIGLARLLRVSKLLSVTKLHNSPFIRRCWLVSPLWLPFYCCWYLPGWQLSWQFFLLHFISSSIRPVSFSATCAIHIFPPTSRLPCPFLIYNTPLSFYLSLRLSLWNIIYLFAHQMI